MDLDCQKIDEGLVEFLYGEFDEEKHAAFEQHLKKCPTCSAAAKQLLETKDIFGALEDLSPPPLEADDPILAAAMAKAEEMAAPQKQPEAEKISFWDKILATFRAPAFRPAFGTALTVLIVAGVVTLLWTDYRDIDSISDIDDQTLVPVTESETRAPVAQNEQDNFGALPPTPQLEQRAENDETQARDTERLQQELAQNQTKTQPSQVRQNNRNSKRNQPVRYKRTQKRLDSNSINLDATPVKGSPQFNSDVNTVTSGNTSISVQNAPSPVVPTPPLPSANSTKTVQSDRAQPPTPQKGGMRGQQEPQPERIQISGQEHYNQGMQHYQAGHYRDAADELNAFVRSPSAPAHLVPNGLHRLAISQRNSGQIASSAQTYDQLLTRYPNLANREQIMYEAAQVNIRRGNFARAESLLRQLERNPRWRDRAQTELARLRHRRSGQDGTLGPPSPAEAAQETTFDAAEEAEIMEAPAADIE